MDTLGGQLRTEKQFAEAEFVVDFKFPPNKEDQALCRFILRDNGSAGMHWMLNPDGKWEYGAEARGQVKNLKPAGEWNRLQVVFDKEKCRITVNGQLVREEILPSALPNQGVFGLRPAGEMDFSNVLVRELRK